MSRPTANTAFDALDPPARDLLDDCVHCGFCLPACPTYGLWKREEDSPRGRIDLMALGREPGSTLSPEMVSHFDACLGCMACVTACPSGVKYDALIEQTRAQVERNHSRTLRERVERSLAFATFTHPGRLRVLAPLASLAQALRVDRLLMRAPAGSKLHSIGRLTPAVEPGVSVHRLRMSWPASGRSRGRVAVLQGCVQRAFFGRVNEATCEVLAAEGFDVEAPRAPRCCGALHLHSGRREEARALARRTIESLEHCDFVVTNAAGCGSALKDYGRVFENDGEWGERARAFSAKARDVSELLAGVEPRAARHPLAKVVAYHDPCHLAHAQGIRAEPRSLLARIPDLKLREPEDWSTCCGSAGLYNLLAPETADELGRRKVERLRATGATIVVAANPGCALQIEGYSRYSATPLRTIHPIELVRMSMRGDDRI